jgi:hypothetical protein
MKTILNSGRERSLFLKYSIQRKKDIHIYLYTTVCSVFVCTFTHTYTYIQNVLERKNKRLDDNAVNIHNF